MNVAEMNNPEKIIAEADVLVVAEKSVAEQDAEQKMTALWQLYKEQQTTEIRNEIVLQYTGLVKKIVLRFKGSYSNFGQLDDISNIIQAYEKTGTQQSIREYEKTKYPQRRERLVKKKKADVINDLRTEMFLDAENTLKEHINDHIFYLEEPTGAGKSNTALNLSFQIIKKVKNINKIFYIYPFNTLVDQNIENLGKIFGNQKDIMNQIAVVNSLVPMKEEKEPTDACVNLQRLFLLAADSLAHSARGSMRNLMPRSPLSQSAFSSCAGRTARPARRRPKSPP